MISPPPQHSFSFVSPDLSHKPIWTAWYTQNLLYSPGSLSSLSRMAQEPSTQASAACSSWHNQEFNSWKSKGPFQGGFAFEPDVAWHVVHPIAMAYLWRTCGSLVEHLHDIQKLPSLFKNLFGALVIPKFLWHNVANGRNKKKPECIFVFGQNKREASVVYWLKYWARIWET